MIQTEQHLLDLHPLQTGPLCVFWDLQRQHYISVSSSSQICFVYQTAGHAGEPASDRQQPPFPSPPIQRAGPLAPAPPPEASQPPSTPRYIAEPDEEDMEDQAPVTHVLLCSADSHRLYPAEGIRTGERCCFASSLTPMKVIYVDTHKSMQ